MIVHGKIIEFFPYVYAPSREESRFKEFFRRSQMCQVISHVLYDRTSLYEKGAYALYACIVVMIDKQLYPANENGLNWIKMDSDFQKYGFMLLNVKMNPFQFRMHFYRNCIEHISMLFKNNISIF